MTEEQLSSAVAISVIVPTYQPGDGIQRVIDSLDAQTLPAGEFEVILIDDGSPDDTIDRLRDFAAVRPNYWVEQIENSGWPSKPRNLATRMARGEYVVYMDHDDSLYPGALEGAVAYARRVGADVLNVKETKSSDPWWCMSALREGNAVDIKADHRVDRMLPMVPHKVYRRQFLLDHGISYPEGRRMLWEDIYFNVEAYAKAERVSVLADTPFYVWHSSTSNNSKTYGPLDTEFWDRMDDLMAFIDRTLAAPELAEEHREVLLHQYRSRVIGRLGKALQKATPEQTVEAMARARKLQALYVPVQWDDLLGPWYAARAEALRADRPDILTDIHRFVGTIRADVRTTRVDWDNGVLDVAARVVWTDASKHPVQLERYGDRLGIPWPDDVASFLGQKRLDLTEIAQHGFLELGVRSRDNFEMWALPVQQRVILESADGGRVQIAIEAHTRFDAAEAAMGAPVAPAVWDVRPVVRWSGLNRGGGLHTDIPARAALFSGTAGVAYRSMKGTLAVDLRQKLRSVVSDGGAPLGALKRQAGGYSLELPAVSVAGDTDLPFEVLLWDVNGGAGPAGLLHARLVATQRSACAIIEGDVPRGTEWRLTFWTGSAMLKSRYVLVRTRDSLELRSAPPTTRRPAAPVRVAAVQEAPPALAPTLASRLHIPRRARRFLRRLLPRR